VVRVRSAVVCAAAALAGAWLAGCGGGSGERAQPPGTRGAAPPGGQITIDEPVDGHALRARETNDGGLRLRARVRGRAPSRSTVFLSASCVPRPCTARATAGRSGRWSARIVLRTPRSSRFVTIDANASEQVAAPGSAVATVELVSPRRVRRALRRDAARARSTPGARSPAPDRAAPARPALPREVLVIGDSLAVGMADALKAALPGWRVSVDAKTSRPLAEGMRILGTRRQVPAIVAFSLFTNDDPRGTSALEAAVRASATRPGGCAVWATIVAPPIEGVDYGAANQLVRGLASAPELALSLQVVDWSAAVAESPSLVAGDGVHGTPAGYRARGQLYADAIRACAGAG
jgi:hypothetical protein